MSKLEIITPKQLIEELLPARYGKAEGEYKFIFQDHVIDGSIVGITYNEELLASSPEYVQIYDSQRSMNQYE